MRRFRKKPVVIEAMQWPGDVDESDPRPDELEAWVRSSSGDDVVSRFQAYDDGTLQIQTLEGTMTAQPGDWIIRGGKGEFYPCKPDIFEATYEPALSGAEEEE